MPGDLMFELRSDPRAIEQFVELLVERGARIGFDPGRLRLNLRVGVTEALANAMLYGNRRDPAKRVRVRTRFTTEMIVVTVTDEGHGFDPEHVPDPTLPANIRKSRGRGIFLIRRLMDHVEYNERGNSVEMRLLNGPAGPVAQAS